MMDMTKTLKDASERFRLKRYEYLTQKGIEPERARKDALEDAKRYAKTLGYGLKQYEEHAYYDYYLRTAYHLSDCGYADKVGAEFAEREVNNVSDLVSDLAVEHLADKDMERIETVVLSLLTTAFDKMTGPIRVSVSVDGADDYSSVEVGYVYGMLVTDEIDLDDAADLLNTTPDVAKKLLDAFRSIYSKNPSKKIKNL